MITFGKGGWTYETLYNMPVFMRDFYIHEMTEVWKKVPPTSGLFGIA